MKNIILLITMLLLTTSLFSCKKISYECICTSSIGKDTIIELSNKSKEVEQECEMLRQQGKSSYANNGCKLIGAK